MKYNFKNQGVGWRMDLLSHFQYRRLIYNLNFDKSQIQKNGDIYQFGVWNGFSLQVMSYIMRLYNQISPEYSNPRYFGFDVFTGMPVEQNEPDKQIDLPGWYNILDHFNVKTLDEALKLLHDDVQYNMEPGTSLTFIPGLVENTLTDDLIKKHGLKPASYVDMDMDIYSPTKTALDFMFKHKLIVEGTIIGYDDWGQNYPQSDTFTCGESRAHKEICEKYGVTCLQLLETEQRGQTAFLVVKINE